MAGFYPDVPGNRIPYDLDGTAILSYNATLGYTEHTQGQKAQMNDENIGPGGGYAFGTDINDRYVVVMFPRLMDISGFFLSASGYASNYPNTFVYSLDTTNGIDGTWTAWPSPPSAGVGLFAAGGYDQIPALIPQYRDSIKPVNLMGVRSLRWNVASGGYQNKISTLHIYGLPSTGEDSNRIELWHPTLNQRISGAYFDWGDAQRTTNATKTFRIKNLSPTLTANSVDITFEVLTDTTPTYDSMHTFSDGGAYAGTINIGNLAPSAVSGTITIKRDFPANAVLGLWAGRINTTATSWT